MEIADHLHGKGSVFVQNLRYPGTAPDVTFKVAPGKPPGLDVIQERLNWIRQWNTEVFFLIGFDKGCQYLQPVSFPCSRCSIKDTLDFFKSRIIICLCSYGFDSHGEDYTCNGCCASGCWSQNSLRVFREIIRINNNSMIPSWEQAFFLLRLRNCR